VVAKGVILAARGRGRRSCGRRESEGRKTIEETTSRGEQISFLFFLFSRSTRRNELLI
jgi:hypothetical protein